MTGMLTNKTGETWRYPKTSEVLKAAGLHTIAHCVQVRRQSIAKWLVDRPMFEMVQGIERRHGTTPCQFWWDQPMDLNKARGVRGQSSFGQ